jgi:Spy/CpxP family protein refolding chaperone
MSKVLKPWLVLAVIFIAGALSGAALTMALAPHFMHPPGEAQMRTKWMTHLTQKLNLTPDQQAKIQPILEDAAKSIQSLHREEVGKVSQIFKSTDDQIAAILTPEQNAELKKMQAEREKAFPGHMHFHGGPDGGPGGEPPHMPPPGPPGAAPAPPSPSPSQPVPAPSH